MKILMRILGMLAIATSAHATLDLELTQGMAGAIPIAIAPFASQENNLQDPNNIAAVVAADLSHSGRFKVPDVSASQQDPHNNQGVDYNFWQKQGMQDLVVGKITPVGGQDQVSFQLINVYAGNSSPNNGNNAASILLNQTFTVSPNNLRQLAHHISDLVYQQLTGDRGIFSTKIAYVLVERNSGPAKYFLEVADQDGYNPHALLTSNEPIMSPAWSPNGKSIAYVSFEGGNDAIYIEDVASGGRRLVSHFPGMNSAPAWSPDGRKLALVLTKTGYPKIYIMDLGSGALTQMTDGYSIDTEPNWAPNGQSMLFTSDRGGSPQIYQINLASKQIQRLTFSGKYNARAAFTPDGNSIVMLTQDGNGYDVALQDLQSGRITQLTNSGNVQSPSGAPNGKMVAYSDSYSGSGILGMVSTDGKVKLRIPSSDGEAQEPAWSPFLD